MTIEMNAVSLNENITEAADTWKYPEEPLPNNLIIPEKTHGWQVYGERRADGDAIISYLTEVNGILQDTPFQIAYRVRDEFLLYAYNYSKYADLPETWLNEVYDEMTFMKILPRIEGDEEKTEVLKQLIELFRARNLAKSLHKAEEMENKRTRYHYTSFWS